MVSNCMRLPLINTLTTIMLLWLELVLVYKKNPKAKFDYR